MTDKRNNYYRLKEKIFYEPLPEKIMITILEVIKNLPKEIQEKILHTIKIETIRDRYVYEKIMEEFEKDLYYYEIFESG